MTEHELIDYGVSVGWLTPEKAKQLKKEFPEIVRCKDCKHKWWVNSENRKIVCRYCYGEHEPDWFCGDGEKQT